MLHWLGMARFRTIFYLCRNVAFVFCWHHFRGQTIVWGSLVYWHWGFMFGNGTLDEYGGSNMFRITRFQWVPWKIISQWGWWMDYTYRLSWVFLKHLQNHGSSITWWFLLMSIVTPKWWTKPILTCASRLIIFLKGRTCENPRKKNVSIHQANYSNLSRGYPQKCGLIRAQFRFRNYIVQ